MLSTGKLARKTRRRLRVLGATAGGTLTGPPVLAPCYVEGACTSCETCEQRAPLSRATWGALRRSSRVQSARFLEDEEREAAARAWIRRRDWQAMRAAELAETWAAEEREAADRALVERVAGEAARERVA